MDAIKAKRLTNTNPIASAIREEQIMKNAETQNEQNAIIVCASSCQTDDSIENIKSFASVNIQTEAEPPIPNTVFTTTIKTKSKDMEFSTTSNSRTYYLLPWLFILTTLSYITYLTFGNRLYMIVSIIAELTEESREVLI
jgi:hypothetical protein